MGRRGPKPKGGNREANGRLSRRAPDIMSRLQGDFDKVERETLRTGIEARSRHHGYDAKTATDQRAGSFVGRLVMVKEISEQQYEAALRFSEVYAEMQVAIGGPRPSGAVNLNATKGLPGPENTERAKKALADWRAAEKAVQAKQDEIRGHGALYAALDCCVLRDEPQAHMIEWLKIGLGALAEHFKIGDKRKAA